MDRTAEHSAARPVETTSKRGWADVAYALGGMIITRNLLLPVMALAFLLLCAYRMNSTDLRAVLEKVLDRKWFAVLGWILFIVTVFISIKVFKVQARIYKERVDELRSLNEGSSQPPLRLEGEPKK